MPWKKFGVGNLSSPQFSSLDISLTNLDMFNFFE